MLLDVMLHMGTLLAVLIVFRDDILDMVRAAARMALSRRLENTSAERMIAAIVVGSVPTALIGFLFADQLEKMFTSMTDAGVGLLITGCLLMLTEWKKHETATEGSGGVRPLQAVIVGVAQGVAIVPGISRSGSTIALGMLLGVPRETAARFSFLLSVPAICGALLFELRHYSPAGLGATGSGLAAIAGACVAAGVGIAALILLLRIVKQGKISLFAYYCWVLGALAIVAGLIRG